MRWQARKPSQRQVKRNKPLKRTPLKRSQKPIKRTAIKKRFKVDKALSEARLVVADRCQGRCEGRTVVCTGNAEAVHHLLRRSQGGKHNAENLMALCTACHNWVHANPLAAVEKGLLLKPHK